MGKKILMFALVLLGPISILYFLNRSQHIFKEPPYIGGFEIEEKNGKVDTVYHQVPEYNFTNVLSGKTADVNGKIVILFAVQNTCYNSENIHNCGFYPFHVESILYDDLFKNKKKYTDLLMVSVVTDENGNSVPPSDLLKDKFSAYDQNIWILAEGDIRSYYDFENQGSSYLLLENEKAYNQKAYLSTLLLIDKNRHIRGFFGGRLNAEVREFKDRLSILKKYYQIKNGKG